MTLPVLVIIAVQKKVKENDSKEGIVCYDTHFSGVGPSWLAPSFLGSEEADCGKVELLTSWHPGSGE